MAKLMRSTCSRVSGLRKVMRNADLAMDGSRPIASNVAGISWRPMAQAEPDEAAMPRASRSTREPLPGDAGEDEGGVTGQTAFGVAGQVGARRDPANRVDEHVSGRDQLTVLRLHARIRFVESDGERHGTGHVLAPDAGRVPARLRTAPVRWCAAAYQQRSQTFGVPNLCPDTDRASTSQSRKRIGICPAACTASTWMGTPCAWAMRTSSSTGSTVPTSLLASMVETIVVRSLGLAVELAFKCVEIEMCLRIHGNAHDFETEPFVQPCRRLGHGRVLDSWK